MSQFSADDLYSGIRSGDRALLARAITLVESTLPEDRKTADELVSRCISIDADTIRVGITGSPGVGKSTFIEAFGSRIIDNDGRIAVLAVDPTSDVSGGSILGDKTRMQRLASHPNAFVRPSPSGGKTGGVARKTREAIFLCEAAGYDAILVETVGAGQADTAVHSMVDFFLLLALAGAGDELQGIKRGIVEMADTIVITKADGNNENSARQARSQLRSALSVFPPKASGWKPRVLLSSAVTDLGFDEILSTLHDFTDAARTSGRFEENRRDQNRFWLRETLEELLLEQLHADASVAETLVRYENMVVDGEISTSAAAGAVLEAFRTTR